MANVLIELSNPQLDVFDCRSRFRVVVAGRRFGKTVLALSEIIAEGSKKGRNIVYVAPTYGMAKRLMWKPLMKRIPPRWIGEKSVSDLTFEFRRTGSRVTLFGSKNYDNIRGDGNDLIIFDEGADIPQEAWEEAGRPSLSDRKGRALFIGTPKGRGNWLYDIWQSDNWKRFGYTTLDGGWVDAEEIEAAKKELDERTFRQEYEASFETSGSLVYYCFGEENIARHGFDPKAWTFATWDFNRTDVKPMVCLLGQPLDNRPLVDRHGRIIGGSDVRYAVKKEFVYPNTGTEDMCKAIVRYFTETGFTGPLIITGDIAGKRRESSASHSDYETIAHYLGKWVPKGAKLPIVRSTRSIQDRVAATNSLFRSMDGTVRLYVDPSCKNLIDDLQRTEWADNGVKLNDDHGKRTDESDALSYFPYNFHDITKKTPTVRHRG